MKWTSDDPIARLFAGPATGRFGRRQRRPRGGRVPVVVVTGFLGAGKTTLVRRLLESPEGANTAVVVNEFGEVGIDDALLRASTEEAVLLGNGCLCCSLRSDLQSTLRGLFTDRSRGAVPSFARVIIETSGLADPTPILQTFATDRGVLESFHLQALVTVVDAVNGERSLAAASEARRQAAVADRFVLTKTDLASAEDTDRLRALLGALNPAAPIAVADHGRIDPDFLLGEGAETELPRFLADAGPRHSDGVSSFTIALDGPIRWEPFARALELLAVLRGPDLLRMKGILEVEGCAGPVVVHQVQHLTHPAVELTEWPGGERGSRLVFITRGIPQSAVEQLLAAAAALAAPPDTRTEGPGHG